MKAVLEDAQKNTGVKIRNVFADKGYRGCKHWPEDKEVLISGRRRLEPRLRKLLRRRSAIEPIFGHLKTDHRLKRNFLKGKLGDHQNALLAGAAFNFKKLLRYWELVFVFLFALLESQKKQPSTPKPLLTPAF